MYCNRNTDAIGILKIETPDTVYIDELCALRAKAYAYIKPDTQLSGREPEEKKKLDGFSGNVTKTKKIVECVISLN